MATKNANLNLNLNLTSLAQFEDHATLADLDKEYKEIRKKTNTFAGTCSMMWSMRSQYNFVGVFKQLLGLEFDTKAQFMKAMKAALAGVHEALTGEMEEDGTFTPVYVVWGKKAVKVDLGDDAKGILEQDGHFFEFNKTVYILDENKKKVYQPNATKVGEWSIDLMWKFFKQDVSLKLRGVVAEAIIDSEKVA